MSKTMTGKFISCLECNKEIYIPKNRIDTAKFCSRSCGAKYARQEITRECAVCNSMFTHISSRSNKAKYCSRNCYYKAMNEKGSILHKCKHCEKEFLDSPSKNRIYCSKKCVNKETKQTFIPTYNTVRKQMLRRNMINECQKCGYNKYPEILGVHHIDKNPKNNGLDNLIVLCPNCHSLEHMKHICH